MKDWTGTALELDWSFNLCVFYDSCMVLLTLITTIASNS